ncbi:hypothetical protein G9C85_14155 [Halorubellus sp. JP-L1]|uniref:hypothetical protein n=1 Tax=Halorubellus sp. JP-L1 TaxID=2715753 RepID=UPI00140D4510|nr:hypothetical protein [Halorubellus sp. JP-L1]NHN42765.1 hypothetical protein [Halorubellus sp. JP-L1]
MSAVPGGIDTDVDLPLAVPLRHFLVALGFLAAGALVGVGAVADLVPGLATLAQVHLLFAGWICVTIMGAMTQFVPVWSGTSLHSERLARLQLVLVVAGVTGFVGTLLFGSASWLPAFGLLMLAGFWTFAYNVARTLATLEDYDVTERHFAYALGFFVVLTLLGILIAVDLTHPATASLPVGHEQLVQAHATVAVFGAVLTTVYGALYQLGTMFTQTELHDVDLRLQSFEAVAHPVGVVLLAGGRLVDSAIVARLGGLLVLASALAVAVVLGRKLVEMRVDWEPMHRRYAVVAVALATWAVTAGPAWLADPTARAHLFGAAGSVHLLALGVLGAVVLGTLYHIVPFIIWVDRYSDRLGFEPVPMIDDLYDHRLAAADGTLWVGGTVLLLAAEWTTLPTAAAGGIALTAAVVVFTTNVGLVVHRHGPDPLDRVILGSLSPRRRASHPETEQ